MKNDICRKIKVLQLTDWSFEPMDEYIQKGGEAFSVSRFGYEYLRQWCDLEWITPSHKGVMQKILERLLGLEGSNLVLQIQAIKRSKQYDVIYYSADRHPYLLALARKLRIVKTPILMLCHFSYDDKCVDGKLKKLLLKKERKLVFRNMDQILFNCETLMRKAISTGDLPEQRRKVSGWGADLEYFARGERHKFDELKPFYFSAGGANRDYHVLIEAFRRMEDVKLVLSCPKSVLEAEGTLPANIIYFDYQSKGLDAYALLRSYYQDCSAVLIPVLRRNHVANGASVMAEAMACGKPIIATNLETNFIDIEKEGIGYTAQLGDVNSWVMAISRANNDIAKLEAMGKRSLELAKKEYNYFYMAENVYQEIVKLYGRDRAKKLSNLDK